MKPGAWWLPVALLAACGTVEPGQGQDLSIQSAVLPDAVVGRDYRERNVVLQAQGGSGALSWSLPQLPPSLVGWLSIGESTGRLEGTPLDLVTPSVDFVVQVTRGGAQAQQSFRIGVGCAEGATTACGVPDATMCIAGTRVCLNGQLGACTASPGRPPYEADAAHCGPACSEICSRTSSNRCVGTCTCGGEPGPCSGGTPACCAGPDGRPESFACVSLQTPEHCGACQTLCQARTNTGVGCSSSSCTYPCTTGYRNCNGLVSTDGADADGCETRVLDNVSNCGACGKACPATLPTSLHTAGTPPTCTDGGCRYACALPQWHDCSGTPGICRDFTTDQDSDGCESDFSSVNNCGGHGVCPVTIPNAHAVCTLNPGTGLYACGQQCGSGFDPDPCGGVCKPLNDPLNCGMCGRECQTVDTEFEHQQCTAGKCCTQICDPDRKPPCTPEICL